MDIGESFLQMIEKSTYSKTIMEGVVDDKDD